jgi:hypothetical protein
MEQFNATRDFLGSEIQRAAAWFEFYDVQGLWGGRRIYVEGIKRAVVQLIQPKMLERRYEFAPGKDEIIRLLDLFVANDFLTIQPSERPGIPDEVRPRITLVNAAGDKWAVAKWAGVKDERFDRYTGPCYVLKSLLRRSILCIVDRISSQLNCSGCINHIWKRLLKSLNLPYLSDIGFGETG